MIDGGIYQATCHVKCVGEKPSVGVDRRPLA